MNKKFKAIIAGVMATATVATMAFSASATNVTTSNYNNGLSYSTNMPSKITASTISSSNELSWNFLNDKRTSNADGKISIKLKYNASSTSSIGDIIASLYAGCTTTDAFIWTEKMHITDVNGHTVIAELRYDKTTGRYIIVNLGTYEKTFSKSRSKLTSYFLDNGIMNVTLSNFDQSGYTPVGKNHNITSKDVNNSSAGDSLFKNSKVPTTLNGYASCYIDSITFNRRIVGTVVKETVTLITYDNANHNKVVKSEKLTSYKNMPRTSASVLSNGDIKTTWINYLTTINGRQNKLHNMYIELYGNDVFYYGFDNCISGSITADLKNTYYITEYGTVNSLSELDYGTVTWSESYTENGKTKYRSKTGTKKAYILATGKWKEIEVVNNNLITLTLGKAYTKSSKDLRNASYYINSSYSPDFQNIRNSLADEYGNYSITVFDNGSSPSRTLVGYAYYDYNHNTRSPY